LSYATKYDWTGASLLQRTPDLNLGNTLENSQTRNLRGDLNFEQLYNKSKFLRAVYAVNPTRHVRDSLARSDTGGGLRGKDPNQLMHISPIPKFFLQMVTALKRVSIQYGQDI